MSTFPIVNDAGEFIDSHFSVECIERRFHIILESRGGTAGSSNARNLEYATGMKTLLERLQKLNAIIEDVLVDTKVTRSMGLTADQRRLQMENFDYPIDLSECSQLESLRLSMGSAQRPIGRRENATGSGNNTKRIRIVATIVGRTGGHEELSQVLAGWVYPIHENANREDEPALDFEPSDIVDARVRRLKTLVQRQGQPAFRKQILSAYNGKCCIRNCEIEEVLEAAHICPYLGPNTNTTQNGLLLRADIHTLFDRNLIGIDPVKWHVKLAMPIRSSSYGFLHEAKVDLPQDRQFWPSKKAIDIHLRELRQV